MHPLPHLISITLPPSHCEPLIQIPAEWKKCIEGQWTSIHEEWSSEPVASAHE